MSTLFIDKNSCKQLQERTDTDPLTWRSFIEVKPEVVCLLPPQLQPRSFAAGDSQCTCACFLPIWSEHSVTTSLSARECRGSRAKLRLRLYRRCECFLTHKSSDKQQNFKFFKTFSFIHYIKYHNYRTCQYTCSNNG